MVYLDVVFEERFGSSLLTLARTPSAMGCCMGKSDAEELQPAFDPVIGLSDSFKASSVTVDGVMISGSGSIFGDSPVLQVCCIVMVVECDLVGRG